jgi:hypothetical protein
MLFIVHRTWKYQASYHVLRYLDNFCFTIYYILAFCYPHTFD